MFYSFFNFLRDKRILGAYTYHQNNGQVWKIFYHWSDLFQRKFDLVKFKIGVDN